MQLRHTQWQSDLKKDDKGQHNTKQNHAYNCRKQECLFLQDDAILFNTLFTSHVFALIRTCFQDGFQSLFLFNPTCGGYCIFSWAQKLRMISHAWVENAKNFFEDVLKSMFRNEASGRHRETPSVVCASMDIECREKLAIEAKYRTPLKLKKACS